MTKQHSFTKKVFAILLSLAMVLTMMPATVWSAETDTADALSNDTHTNHCVCGKTHQAIGDHESADEKTFEPWDKTESLPTEGAYYLTEDVTISGNVELSKDVTLCLNGKTVSISNGGINVVGGAFTLTDCSSDNAGKIQGIGKQGVAIHANEEDNSTANFSTASFVMYGGKLTGFSNAVVVGSQYSLGCSSFTMYGGTITGNNTKSAAAVSGLAKSTHVGDNRPSSVINMYGGEISNNTGEAGGGVYIGDNCTFTLADGKISNNTATGRDVKDPQYGEAAIPVHNGGGGVYLDSWGKFYMTGGEISGNKASGVGGGVCVMSYVTSYGISITGGKIIGNESTNNSGGGIYGGSAKLTIKNTEISGNRCAGSGGGIYTTKPLTLEKVKIIDNTASTNGGYEGGGVKIGGDSENFEDEPALTVSGNTSISDNAPNNYYVDWSYLLPVKVSGALDAGARIGICMNQASANDKNFLPTAEKDSVVATAAEGVTLSANNFFADSYNSDYVVRTEASGNVTFGLCDHNVPEGSNKCSKCGTEFVAVLEPTNESAKKEYFRDLSGVELSSKNGTLKLLETVMLSTGSISMWGGALTLDLNGHTISGDRSFTLNNKAELTVIDSSETPTTSRTLNVYFTVNAGCALNLYDGTNEQGFQGTIPWIKLTRTGRLVSCGGKIETLWLYRGDTESYAGWRGLKLWQDNDHYCSIGAIKNSETATGKAVIYVKDLLNKTHPNCTLYGTKDGKTTALTGDYVKITSEGVEGGYTDLYLQACDQHEPKSNDEMICAKCGAKLVVEISATKGDDTKNAYFTKDSSDTTRWDNGHDEAAAQLTDWVTDGYTDAKLIPHGNLEGGSMRLTCKMTLVGGTYEILGSVSVKDGADVTFEGGTYKDSISVTDSTASFKGGTYYGKITAGSGTATFEKGTFNSVAVTGGTATVKSDATFSETNSFAKDAPNTIEVTGGTLNVEGGTIGSKVAIEKKGSLTISGGTFTNEVTIDYTTSGTCIISDGTFNGTVNVWLNTSSAGTCTISGGTFAKLKSSENGGNLSALLADGYHFYNTKDEVANGEVKELTNVTVKSGHTHSFDPNTGACSECGAQMAASVTVGEGQPAYYATIEAAVTALNAVDGTKTLKLFQDRKSGSATYTLEKGPVTLDLSGKALNVATFVAQGITLTLKGAESGGLVYAVQAVEGGTVVAKKDDITEDGNVTVRTISAQEGGALKLSAGTFRDLYVVNDGSKANLAGGTYMPESSYEYGKGPDKDTKYVGAYDMLAKGYGYQKKQSDGNFKWDTSGRILRGTDNNTYKVAEIGASFERIYPDDETNFTGDTYLIKLEENETTYTLKLTAVSTDKNKVSYQWQSERADGGWTNRPQKSDTAYEVDAANGTLTIKDLSAGTYRYRVQYTLKDSNGNDALTGDSQPLTVVVTKHEHSWTYELKEGTTDTITAKCTADDCYLTDRNGGSVTIHAPAADTLTYDGNRKPATLTWTDWVDTEKKNTVESENSIWYTGTINNGKSYNGNLAPADAGKYTASLTMTNGDGSKVKAESEEYTLKKATLTVTGTPVATASYNKNLKVQGIPISGLSVTFNGTTVDGTWKFDSNAHPEVGDTTAYTATFKPKSTYDAGNYEMLTTQIVPTITKGTYDRAAMAYPKNVLTGEAQTDVEVSMMPNITDAAIVKVEESSDPDNIIEKVRHENGKVYFDVNNVSEGGLTATITVTYSSKNYNDFTGTITVKTVKKDPVNITITGLPDTVTYGDEFTLEATQTDDEIGTNKKWTWDYDTEYFKLIESDDNTGTLKLQAIKAGTPSKDITMTYESSTRKGSQSVTVSEVTKRKLTAKFGDYIINKGEAPQITISYSNFAAGDTEETVIAQAAVAYLLKNSQGAEVTLEDACKTAGTYTIVFDENTSPKLQKGKEADYEISLINGTLTVKNPSSGGGSSGGGAALPTTEVKTITEKTGETEKTITTSPGKGKTETREEADGSMTMVSKITVSDENQKEIIKQVKDNKSEEIVIKVSDKDMKDGTKLEIAFDKDFVDSIIKDTDAKLTIRTPEGDKTFTQGELKELSESAAADGTITVDPTASEPTDPTKAEKITKAKGLIEKLNLVVRSSRTTKKNVKVVLKKDRAYSSAVEELKDLGFTVKYRFYRSTKKSAGYKSTITGKTASYTNTSGKKNTKYYYKVQVRVYDENGKLIAKTALKQCKYASRTWTK